ncbi:MAG: glycosyltransferase [Crocinitomicaceae bacterium]
MNDLEHNQNLHRYPVSFKWNKILANKNLSFYQKIIYKFFMFWARKSKYNPYDNTAFSQNQIVDLASQIIDKNQIDTVVVTGAPFNLLYFGAEIKKRNNIKLMLDYRDLWNGHPIFSKFQKLTQKQLDYCLYQERVALQSADTVLAVDDGLKSQLIKLVDKSHHGKFHVIHNGYDVDDFYLDYPKTESQRIKIMFAGNIDANLSNLVKSFVSCFKNLKSIDSQIYEKFELIMHMKTNDKELYEFLHAAVDNQFIVHDDFLPKDEYYKKLREVQCGVFFLSEVYSDAFITKFSDFIVNENFIIQVGFEGECAKYLRDNKIGATFEIGEGAAFFKKLKDVNFSTLYTNYDSLDFNLEKIAKKLKLLITKK